MSPRVPKTSRRVMPTAARVRLGRKLAKQYAGGKSVRALSADCGRSYGFTWALLREVGVEFRARGGDTRPASVRGQS